MKRVLIWDIFPLKNSGGPAGYLYNIKGYLKDNPNPQVTFLSDLWQPESKIGGAEKQSSFLTKCKDYILRKTGFQEYQYKKRKIKEFVEAQFFSPLESHPLIEILDCYDYIHFHGINDLSRFKVTYPNYKGKLILSSHCPCPVVDEMITYWEPYCTPYRNKALLQECKCYGSADYLMFPCKGAREPYEKEEKIRDVFLRNETKFFYVPSSILDINIDEDKMQRFSELGIPEDAFVITYFGRHNTIKGYDILKQIGEKLLEIYPNLYFLCAGNGEIEPLAHPRWKELGFISNTHELLYQSDLYILPNRETYFDLVVLEVLRSSTPIIVSNTGGNIHFMEYPESETAGIMMYEDGNLEELVNITKRMIDIKTKNITEYSNLCKANRRFFLNHFTMNHYIERYTNAINSL